MSSVSNLAKAVAKAASVWDPAKHPKGRDGRFIEVGDLVALHASQTSGQVGTGKVIAGHYDGIRMWIAVQTDSGAVSWWRPKQVEQINPKAVLLPKAPLPEAGTNEKAPSWASEDATHYKNWVNIAHNDPSVVTDVMLNVSDVSPIKELVEAVALAVKFDPAKGAVTDTATMSKLKDQLQLIVASAKNKGLPQSTVDLVQSNVDAASVDPDPVTGHKKLATAMTLAKLGGKQRARYKQILDEMFDREPATPQVPASVAEAHPAGAGVHKPVTGSKPLKSVVPTLTAAGTYVDPPMASAGNLKGEIQERISAGLSGRPVQEFADVLVNSPGIHGAMTNALVDIALGKQPWPSGNRLVKTHQGDWVTASATANVYAKVSIDAPSQADIERAVRETAVRALVQTWASTSNDNNVRSLVMQDMAAEEFGLDQAHLYEWYSKPAYYDEHVLKHRGLYRAFLREMYNQTQESLKAQGWTHVRLRRGVKNAFGLHSKGEKGTVALRPMSSFSASTTTAKNFGGWIMDAYVPIERIVGSALTGFGCKNEREFVVLGGYTEVALHAKPGWT